MSVFVRNVKVKIVNYNFKENFIMEKIEIFDPAMCCCTEVCGTIY